MKWSHWASSPRVSTRVHTQKARKAATSMQTQWRVGQGRYAFHRIETLDSVAVNLNTGFVFVVCILSTWKKKKKTKKLQAYSAKVSLFQGSAFFLNRVAGCLNSGWKLLPECFYSIWKFLLPWTVKSGRLVWTTGLLLRALFMPGVETLLWNFHCFPQILSP